MNSICVSRVPRMSSWMLCSSRRCFYKSRCYFFINQEVRRQLLINAIFKGDGTLIIPLLSRTSSAKCVDILQDVLQGILQALHPNSLDNIVHTAAKGQLNPKPLKNASVFGTKNLFAVLAAIIGLQSPSKMALIGGCRLTSLFIKFIRRART